MGVFDGHTDLLCDVAARRLRGETDVFRRRHLDRFRAGGIEGGIFVIWVETPYQHDPASRAKQLMVCAAEEFAKSTALRLVRSCKELDDAVRDGVIYALIGVEGLDCIGGRLEGIDVLYAFGARTMMLTWNEVNALAAGAMSGDSGGLTPLGKRAVRHIQERGILLDVSHLNDAGFRDVMGMTQAPVIASHSNCRSMCDVPRNLTDDQLRAIRDVDGVVGLNIYRGFVSREPAEQTVEKLAEHAVRMIDIMGIDHVACGFDFCEFLEGESEADASAGLKNCAQVPNLVACFERMGMTRGEREKIALGNFHRVLRQVIG